MRVIVGITGASGARYGIRLLEVLPAEKHVVVSVNGWKVIERETEYSRRDIGSLASLHGDDDFLSPLASGSFLFDAFVICPCSLSTVGKLASGIGDTLITRLGAVALKERRTLCLVVRETPLPTIALENLARLSLHGAIVLPAMPAFYPRPRTVDDIVDFVAGKILDVIGIGNQLFERWKGGT
jgi:4-hydroxy-3-polyprenylbenzoate decarboxylase